MSKWDKGYNIPAKFSFCNIYLITSIKEDQVWTYTFTVDALFIVFWYHGHKLKLNLMKILVAALLIIGICLACHNHSMAQIERISKTIDPIEAEAHLRFLTADELKGRNTGTSELLITGRYIAEQFRRFGLIPLGDVEEDYLQRVPLHTTQAPTEALVTMLDHEFKIGKELAMLAGNNGSIKAPMVYLTSLEDYPPDSVKGKVVVTVLRNPRSAMTNPDLVKSLEATGAAGLIQLFGPGQRIPWKLILNYLNQERMLIGDSVEEDEQNMPHLWVHDSANVLIQQLKENPNGYVSIDIKGIKKIKVEAYNVVGKVEGIDPELKQEHFVMCAHYDHVGVQAGEGADSIYNGTRDNGIGTTGLLNAAKYFGKYPPRRSIIIIALTGEEKGLLGSQYYVNHPKIPLEKTVFAFNIDNSGYTDTDAITLLDTNRTNIDKLVYQAAAEVGLGVTGDRLPSQNYYERSDQVSFAAKGVPAVNFKMAMTAFDEGISKYYHRPSDEFHSVDLEYIHKYWKAYLRAAELIGNWDQRPYWIEGDKFEPAGNKLYDYK